MLLINTLRQILAGKRQKSRRLGKAPATAKVRQEILAVLPPLVRPPLDRLFNYFAPVFWCNTDSALVEESAKKIIGVVSGGSHFADNFLTWGRNNSMLDDGPFIRAWESNTETAIDHAIVWRRYVLSCAAYHCVQLDGDFVECGAYTGVAMKTVMDYLGGTAFPKTFWGYDLFEHDDSTPMLPMPAHGEGRTSECSRSSLLIHRCD